MQAAVRAVLAVVLAASGCGRQIDLPVEPDATGGPGGEVAYVLTYAWDDMPALVDMVLTRGQVLYGVDPDGHVRSWFSDTATPRENPGRGLPLDPVVAGDTLRVPVQLCEGRNSTLWVAYASPQPTLLQWNVAVTPPVAIDSAVVRDAAFVQTGGIAADPDSHFVYVADTGANTVSKHAPSATGGRRIVTLAAPGTGDFSVQQPHGLYAFGDSLLVADTGKNWLQVISSRTPGTGRGQVAGSAESPLLLRDPLDVWVDTAGFFYVSDSGNGRVLKLTRAGLVKEVVTELDAGAAAAPSTIAATDTRVWVVDPDRGRLGIYKINTMSEDLP
jgi:hypothetical protein